MRHSFISHCEEDSGLALEIASALEAAGHITWYYERDSRPGPSYLVQIVGALERSGAVILVISPRSVASMQMTREVARAHEAGKPIIPILCGLTHADFQHSQPEWKEALSAAAFIRLDTGSVRGIMPRILHALNALGVTPPSCLSEPRGLGVASPPARGKMPAGELGRSAFGKEAGMSREDALAEVPASGRGAFDAGPGRDAVDCTVFAPPEAALGDSIMVQVFAHVPKEAEQARALSMEFDSSSQRRGVTSLGTEIAVGSKLTLELVMRGLKVPEPVRELVWRGRTGSVQFEARIPHDFKPGTVVGRLLVAQDGVPIGRIGFTLAVFAKPSAARSEDGPAGEAKRYEKAFVSYYSKDRAEVLRRVQMLTAVGIKFFQDVFDLEPGDRWERKLYLHIDESDVMFLFWSTAAKESEWVQREWRYAIERKGEDFIRPVIIEGPPVPPPPPELASLHFSDKVLYFIS